MGVNGFDPETGKLEEVTRPHLIPSPGFLETVPQHRTFWTIDTTIRYDIPTGHGGVHGDILTMDGNQFYEVRGYTPTMADKTLFVAGTPVVFPANDLAGAYEGRMGGVLWVASAETGRKLAEYKLDAPPAWDGMAATQGKLYISLNDGSLLCLGRRK